MYIKEFTNEERKIYEVYKKLMEYAPNANINTLRQISIYIGRLSLSENIEFKYNEDRGFSSILLKNGNVIEFNDIFDEFNFSISKKDNKFSMKTLVYLNNPNDLSSINVYSELRIKGYGMYVVTFRPKNMNYIDSLKYGIINYYTEDEIDWIKEVAEESIDNNIDLVAKNNGIFPFSEKIEFDLLMNEMGLDCYQGIIYDVLSRIDLLYDNMKYIRIRRKKLCKEYIAS